MTDHPDLTQDVQFRCDDCGLTVNVKQLTAYEFDAPCKCQRLLAWAHHHPPPKFEAQGRLF